MIKAAYENRAALEAALTQGIAKPREPIALDLEDGEQLKFIVQHTAGNIVSGKMTDAPHALITIDLDTQEVTIT